MGKRRTTKINHTHAGVCVHEKVIKNNERIHGISHSRPTVVGLFSSNRFPFSRCAFFPDPFLYYSAAAVDVIFSSVCFSEFFYSFLLNNTVMLLNNESKVNVL